jgi:tripartite-type tricarboxylate transporter receptor subunit TctC
MQDGIRRLFEMKNINGIDGAQNVATLHLHPLAAAAALVHRARGRIGKEARVKASYDVMRSFTPIVQIGHAPNVLVVHPSVPAQHVKALITLAKAKPGVLAYASNGVGTLSH